MKKLSTDVIRKLIIETIEESNLVEGRKKKKLKEAEPVPQAAGAEDPRKNDPSAGAEYTDWANKVDAQNPPVPNEDNIMDAIKQALEIAKNSNPVVASGARGMLKDLFKQIEQTLPVEQQK